jgi:hypothetical protein
MWIITGPFDGEVPGQLDTQSEHSSCHNIFLSAQENPESKLLKTGKTYKLGRKDTALVVNHKVISKTHGEFKVGTFTGDDVVRPFQLVTVRLISHHV